MRLIKKIFAAAVIAVMLLTITCNNGLNTYAAGAVQTGGSSLISGIVKENNPSLGYLTLYFEDGSGTDPENFKNLVSLRTFTYGYEFEIQRDGIAALPENIQPGDKVFIEFDEEGTIARLSAKSYYRPVYGTIHVKNAAGMTVQKADGAYAYYPVPDSVPIYKNGHPVGFRDLLPGERVRILVQADDSNMDIAGIDIEKNPKPVSGVYRGDVEFFDPMKDALAVSAVQEFINGRWENGSFVGIKSLEFSDDYKARPSSRTSGTVYFATKTANDGRQKIVTAAYRNAPQYETELIDNVLETSSGYLGLENSSETVGYDKDTIVVKNGRLVDITALNTLDPVRVSVERAYGNKGYLANVLVSDSLDSTEFSVYRGRIESVEPTRSITLESFARLDGVTWEFTNTPKTFDINISTSRLIDEDGVGNMRDVDSDYIDKTIYIVAEGTNIKLISTAPYADSPISGRIISLSGETYDSRGNVLAPPDGLKLSDVMSYDTDDEQWEEDKDLEISIPVHAVVMKDGQVGSSSLLSSGDEVKILRHAQSEDAIIIFCD